MAAHAVVELTERAKALSPSADKDFVQLGNTLNDLYDICQSRSDFVDKLKDIGVGYRKARYLMQIAEVARKLKVPEWYLTQIGWTKMMVLAPYLDKDNVEELLRKAKASTVAELKAAVEGRGEAVKQVVFQLTDEQSALLDKVLLKNGASQDGRHLVNKNEALVNLLQDILQRGA